MKPHSDFWRRMAGRVLSFGCIQGAQMLLPLLALPYLARVLDPETFGVVMFLNVVPLVLCFFLDWGFLLGGVRRVARTRGDETALAQIWANALLAKGFLVVPAALFLGLHLHLVPHPEIGLAGLWGAFFAGLARGFSPLWFFQGLGDMRIRRMALLDVASSAVLLLFTVMLVKNPDEGELYLVLTALCKGTCTLWLVLSTCRAYPAVPNPRKALRLLVDTRVFFLGGIAGQVYTNWGQMALAGILQPRDTGIFLVADKMARACVSLASPVIAALFPETCVLQGHADHRPRLAILVLCMALVFGGICAVLLALFAPVLVRLALGEATSDATTCVRLMGPVVFLLTLNTVLTQHMLVASGRERIVTIAQWAAALLATPTALFLAAHWGLFGGILLPLLSEGCIFCVLAWASCRARRESGTAATQSGPTQSEDC